MRLSDVLTGFFWLCLCGQLDIDISGVSDDSRTIERGNVFVCISGAKIDGFDKIEEAIDKGAAAIVASRPCSLECKNRLSEAAQKSGNSVVTWIQTPDTRLAAAKMAAAFYGSPSEKMTMIGITGTKGKTTTAYMLKHIFEAAGHKVGMIGTVEVYDGREKHMAFNTTPGAVSLQKYLSDMVQNGVDTVVMEVSSQGLKQNRTAGICFDAALWTNVYPDHIGENEHEDMEEYVFCKSLIFNQCRLCVVNGDDPIVEKMAAQAKCPIRYFSAAQNYDARYPVRHIGRKNAADVVKVNMPGAFNKANALAAAVVADSMGISPEFISAGLLNTKVPGRTEVVEGPWPSTVMIDYAHNAAALESLLTNLGEECKGRLICMFGCGGNRDKRRRSEMGKVSGMLSNLTVITTDNPRYEKPMAIIQDIVDGIETTEGKYVVIEKREDAIDYCINEGRKNDLIILAGKGHETYQEINGVKYPFDEKAYLRSKIF